MKSTILIAALLSSCAHSDLYEDGKKVAHFEGDMSGIVYKRYADGRIEMTGTINHSAATLAQGQAAASKLGAVGVAVAASGLVSVLK